MDTAADVLIHAVMSFGGMAVVEAVEGGVSGKRAW